LKSGGLNEETGRHRPGAIPRVFQAHEGFEDLLALVGWDAGTLVVDQQGDEFGVCRD
jgi:hypothetical protein